MTNALLPSLTLQSENYTVTALPVRLIAFDPAPLLLGYYRLKQMDFDGTFTHSKIIRVKRAAEAPVVYPNPARERISITGLPPGVHLRITDQTGKMVFQMQQEGKSEIDLNAFENGLYFVRAGDFVKKLMIVR